MNPKIILCLALGISGIFFGCSNATQHAGAGNSIGAETGTVLSLDEALATAKAYVKKQGIDVSKSYIDSASFEHNPRDDRGKYWLITWRRSSEHGVPMIMGGQTFVHVYMNKSVKIFYGE